MSDDKNQKSENYFVILGETIGESFKVIATLLKDPIQGVGNSIATIGKRSAFNVGLFFLIIFVFASYLTGHTILKMSEFPLELFGDESQITFGDYLKLIIFAFVPAVALFGSLWGASLLSDKTNRDMTNSIFAAGVTAIPVAVLMVLWKISSFWQPIVPKGAFDLDSTTLFFLVASVFVFSSVTLLLNAVLQDLYKFSSRKAMLIVPLIIVITTWLSQFVYVQVMA